MKIIEFFCSLVIIAGCSSGGDSRYWDSTHAKSVGLVFECSEGGIINDFAYTADDISEVIEIWQMENKQIVRHERQVWIGNGRVGGESLFGEGSVAAIFYSSLDGLPLLDSGIFSLNDWLAVIDGTNNVTRGYDFAADKLQVYNCTAVEYSLATVGGVLIAS